MAAAAWQYFVTAYQAETGLVNSVGAFPSTTLWDTASYISALVSARELGLIDKVEFDRRAMLLLGTLRTLDLFRGELPNKVYNAATGEKVDYANKAGEVGFSALDIGRLLVWLRIVKERYPYLANAVDNIPMRWKFCQVIGEDGRLFGASVGSNGETNYFQEGRLGYEEYAAKGFGLWGFSARGAANAQPFDFQDIYGVEIPFDGRDPRVFRTQNYVLMESYLLDGLEFGWDLNEDLGREAGVASQGWRAEFATRVYYAQQRRFEQTGILTARSEHQVEGPPYFVYDSVYASGYAWNTLDPDGTYQPERAAVSAKAALGMWVLWDTPYTDLLFEAISSLYDPAKGFQEGIYENGNGPIPLQTANNNGIILAALLYKAQGPILDMRNLNTQLWDTAFENMDTRKTRCMPQPEVVPCPCSQPAPEPPPLQPADYLFCEPLMRNGKIAARNCTVPAMPVSLTLPPAREADATAPEPYASDAAAVSAPPEPVPPEPGPETPMSGPPPGDVAAPDNAEALVPAAPTCVPLAGPEAFSQVKL